MLRRPPQHRIDAPIIYVHPSDGAWDRERIDREIKELRESNKPAYAHPVQRYWDGHTRFDLALVSEYLGDDATRFHFKRLGIVEFQELQGLKDSGLTRRAYLRALASSLTKIENGPPLSGAPGQITADDIERIAELSYYDESKRKMVDIVHDVGMAAFEASMPLTVEEKKA